MARPRSTMRKIKEVLRLQLGEGLSRRQVSLSTGLPYTTVADYLARARRAGVGWPLPKDVEDEGALEARLFARAALPAAQARPLPDWAALDRDLRSRRNVTLALLHVEYKEQHPEGYAYTQFCRHYHAWRGKLDLVMRQEHPAGERCFVDWAGQSVPIFDAGGEISFEAQIFVAVLGASSHTYAEAFPSQELAHWISGHIHAFEAWGGCPRIVVPDNPRTGVTRAHRYEPELHATYAEMAAHFGVAVLPARPRKPRDKAAAEVGVQIVQRWVLARLRKRRFFSLVELNTAIAELLRGLNAKPFRKMDGSRQSRFEELDRPALRPLPLARYEFATRKAATVNIDYHVEVDRHYYSVPYQLAREKVEVRLAATTVEIFHKGKRVASHLRSSVRGGYTTLALHMPESHRRHAEWTPGRIVRWAESAGPQTAALVDGVMRSRPHPEQGFRSCLGIMRLGKRYGDERLEAAAARALAIRSLSYRSVESILKNNLDRQTLPAPATAPAVPDHANLRGPDYYR